MSKPNKFLMLSAHVNVSAKEKEIRQWAKELSEHGLEFDPDDLIKKISLGGGLYDLARHLAETKGINPKNKKAFQQCLDETINKLSRWAEGFEKTHRAREFEDDAHDALTCYKLFRTKFIEASVKP
jgi:hypothetical protein